MAPLVLEPLPQDGPWSTVPPELTFEEDVADGFTMMTVLFAYGGWPFMGGTRELQTLKPQARAVAFRAVRQLMIERTPNFDLQEPTS